MSVLAITLAACTDGEFRPDGTVPDGTAPGQVETGQGGPLPDVQHRVMLWTGGTECANFTEAELDRWAANGVGGFVCRLQTLSGMTAANDLDRQYEWTGDPRADLSAEPYRLQRQLAASPLVKRLKSGEMKAYLTFYTLNRNNPRTVLAEWFDDAGWSDLVLPKVRDISGAARLLGFAGVGFDEELYPGGGTWNWNYQGNNRPEAQVRAQVTRRGQQFMETILAAFPEVELFSYGAKFPETWDAIVQSEYRGPPFDNRVQSDWWKGISSVQGYKAIRFTGELFFKRPFPSTDWDIALRNAQNQLHAYLSRTWTNWTYASARVFQAPAAWLDNTTGQPPSTPEAVATQLERFRVWTSGGEIYIYSYGAVSDFDFRPYLAAIKAASQPPPPAAGPPRLSVSTPAAPASATTVALEGTAASPLAIRSVVVRDEGGRRTAAPMVWDEPLTLSWSVAGFPVSAGANTLTVTVEDIAGQTTEEVVVVTVGPG